MPDLSVKFRWGRRDCSTSPDAEMELIFPEPSMTAKEMFDYYANGTGMGFNLNKRQVVALLGAHTLGRALKENSGYSGPWIGGEQRVFDNNYYKVMVNTSLIWTTRVRPEQRRYIMGQKA